MRRIAFAFLKGERFNNAPSLNALQSLPQLASAPFKVEVVLYLHFRSVLEKLLFGKGGQMIKTKRLFSTNRLANNVRARPHLSTTSVLL